MGATQSNNGAESKPQWLRTRLDVGNLAIRIRDPSRAHPIVCATIPSWASSPLLDANRLAAELGAAAPVFVLPTGDLSWELTAQLPSRLDVYGGAVRIWWPSVTEESDPREHPWIPIRAPSESGRVIEQVVDMLTRRGFLPSRDVTGPRRGAELAGVVTAVRPTGAELRLTGNLRAFAPRDELSTTVLEPSRVVRVGQSVRAVIRCDIRAGRRVTVSLRALQPEPWRRVGECYEAGMLVDGVVDELRNIGAFITLLPGARGLMRKERIRPGGVSHPEDELRVGERIMVRIERLDVAAGKAELSWLNISDDEEPVEPVSLYPDGPPWLPPVLEDDGTDHVEELPAGVEEPVAPDPPDASRPLTPVPAPESTETAASNGDASAAEREALERAVTDGYLLRRELEGLVEQSHRRMGQLKAEAAEMRRALERELVEVRLRILEMTEGEESELVGSTERALVEARREIASLRDQLAAVESDRHELLDRLSLERKRAIDAEQGVSRLRREVRAGERAVEELEEQLDALGLSPGQRFVAEVCAAWERMTPGADRERFPWQEPRVGPEMLASLEQVQGISRSKVVEVCAHIVSGRASEITGLELHALREHDSGGAAQLVRDDGAKAWRCNLQASTAAARRLHFWRLPDGRVEIAKIVYHDDFSIR